MNYGKDIAIAAVEVDRGFLNAGAAIGDSAAGVYLKLLEFLGSAKKLSLEKDINNELGDKIKGLAAALYYNSESSESKITIFIIPKKISEKPILSNDDKNKLNESLKKYIEGIESESVFIEVNKKRYDTYLGNIESVIEDYVRPNKDEKNIIEIIKDIAEATPHRTIMGGK